MLQVYRNGDRVRTYEDDGAEYQGRADSLPNSPLRVRISTGESERKKGKENERRWNVYRL